MATYYPSLSSHGDNFQGPYPVDQKHEFCSELPSYVTNITACNQPVAAAGSYSEIFPERSLSSHNSSELPSIEARNEMLFIPPTSNTASLLSTNENFNSNPTGNSVDADRRAVQGVQHGILDGEQNFNCQALSLSLGTQMQAAVSAPSFDHDFPPFFNAQFHTVGKWSPSCGGDESNPSKEIRNFECFGGFDGGNQNNLQYLTSHKNVNINRDSAYDISCYGNNIITSKYLKAVQHLLDEVVNVQKALKQHKSNKSLDNFKDTDGRCNNQSTLPSLVGMSSDQSESTADSSELSSAERQELQNKKTKLLSMLDEVDRKYKQYYQQMQSVESTFDMVAGRGAAKSYTALALQTISRHFRCLRDAISGQIEVTRKRLGEPDSSANGQVGIPRLRYVDHQLRQHRALQHLGVMQHSWRPQRGLPESSVSILRAWLFEHFLHPYPNDTEKMKLARQTGLTRNQVANWFINARVRLWKPMVEEMYKEEFGGSESKSLDDTTKLCGGNNFASENKPEELQDTVTSTVSDGFHAGEAHDLESIAKRVIHQNDYLGFKGSELKKMHCEKRSNMDDHNPFPDDSIPRDQNNVESSLMSASMTYGIPELSGFTVGGQVSLALGLQPHEAEAFPMSSGALTDGLSWKAAGQVWQYPSVT